MTVQGKVGGRRNGGCTWLDMRHGDVSLGFERIRANLQICLDLRSSGVLRQNLAFVYVYR